MSEHVCPERQVTIGQLQGIRSERGLTYVSVKIPGGEAMVGVDAFPALEWIERNAGRWVKIVKEAGKDLRVSVVDEPPNLFKKFTDPGTGREFVGCPLCGKMIRPVSGDVAAYLEAGRMVAAHMKDAHPEETDRIRATYT